MERQLIVALFLLLILLLIPNVLLFADQSTAAQQTVRYKLASMARTFLGLPYRWGGMSERRGADCSGLVKMIFAKLHIDLPRTSRDQIQTGEEISVDKLETGDLVFFSSDGNTPMHVGVYIGHHQFLHAEKKAGRVIMTDLSQPWYAQRFLAARRVSIRKKGKAIPKSSSTTRKHSG
jgi:cell wall-associated NlpC family hydrolase